MLIPVPSGLPAILLATVLVLLVRHLVRGGSPPSLGRLSSGGGRAGGESRSASWYPEEWVEGYQLERWPPEPDWGAGPVAADRRDRASDW